MSPISRGCPAIILLLACSLAGGETDPRLGWWKGSDCVLLVAADRIVLCDYAHGGVDLAYTTIIAWRPEAVIEAVIGPPSLRTMRMAGANLVDEGTIYTRIAKPAAARRQPEFTLPPEKDIPEARRTAIVAELGRRSAAIAKQFSTRPPPFPRSGTDAEKAAWEEKWREANNGFYERFRSFLKDHKAWLGKLVSDVGWIDAARFGKEAANQAWIMLERLQEDAEANELAAAVTTALRGDPRLAGGSLVEFAQLDDRAHLAIGMRQRYGTMITEAWNHSKAALVGWLEDRQRVDEFRKTVDLPPLAEGMRQWSAQHKGRPVELCDSLPQP